MKTRNELQKENDYMKTLLRAKDEDNLQLKSELEVANNHVQHFQNQILGMVKEQNAKNNEWGNISLEYANQLNEIKSKSLFQLIRWWYNENRK